MKMCGNKMVIIGLFICSCTCEFVSEEGGGGYYFLKECEGGGDIIFCVK